MSVDPNTKLSELDVARYRVLRLLMQSEDLAYLARLEEQLNNVLDPERLAKEAVGKVEPAANIVLPKPLVEMSDGERTAYRKSQRKQSKPPSREDWASLVGIYDELSEEEIDAMLEDK